MLANQLGSAIAVWTDNPRIRRIQESRIWRKKSKNSFSWTTGYRSPASRVQHRPRARKARIIQKRYSAVWPKEKKARNGCVGVQPYYLRMR